MNIDNTLNIASMQNGSRGQAAGRRGNGKTAEHRENGQVGDEIPARLKAARIPHEGEYVYELLGQCYECRRIYIGTDHSDLGQCFYDPKLWVEEGVLKAHLTGYSFSGYLCPACYLKAVPEACFELKLSV